MRSHARTLALLVPVLVIAGACSSRPDPETASTVTVTPVAPLATSPPTDAFPIDVFAGLGDEPVSDGLAAELQQVLDMSADGNGLTATLFTPEGTWSGATGFAAGDRAMLPDDQFLIASITKTLVAAQVMQLVEQGELALDDLAHDRLPPDLEFDANGARIADLLSMRSGLPETLEGDGQWESLTTEPLHAWTTDEVLATVGPERSPVGEVFEYRGTNYVLLGLIIEEVTGRPLAEVLREGVLAGDGYERLIYQPDERPTDPMAMPFGASADTFDDVGRYLPSLAGVTAVNAEGAMASDSRSLARWFRGLCGGEIVSGASLDNMTDFDARPEYGLGIIDRRGEYGSDSGALGHTGAFIGGTTLALCFGDPGVVVVVLANADHDVDTLAGQLVQAAIT